VKAYQSRNSDSIFTTSYKYTYVFNQHQPNHCFRRKIYHFSGEGMDKNTTQNLPKHNTSMEKFIFPSRGPSPPSQTSLSQRGGYCFKAKAFVHLDSMTKFWHLASAEFRCQNFCIGLVTSAMSKALTFWPLPPGKTLALFWSRGQTFGLDLGFTVVT